MDFDLSDEQRQLGDSLDRLLASQYGFEARRKYAQEPDGWSRSLWSRYAELGLLGLPLPQAYGGFGGGAADVMLAMHAFGRVLALEPYLATVVLGATALRLTGNDAQQREIFPRIADGTLLLAWAHSEREARHDLSVVATTARREQSMWTLDGAKSLVLHGDCAHKLVVSARVSGQSAQRDGLGLFLVDGGAKGVRRRGYRLQDGTCAAEIGLAGVRAEPLGEPGAAWPVIARVTEAGIAAVAAEAVGAMEAAQALSVDYLKTRQQFGKPIGQNQALAHRAAEMLVALEQARSMAMLAAMMVEEPDGDERGRNIAMAKMLIGRNGRLVGEQAIQLHGGIGMTEEYAVGHYLRRLTLIDQLFGDSTYHLARLAGACA